MASLLNIHTLIYSLYLGSTIFHPTKGLNIKKKFGIKIDGFGNVLKEKKQEDAEKLMLKGLCLR